MDVKGTLDSSLSTELYYFFGQNTAFTAVHTETLVEGKGPGNLDIQNIW